MMNELTDLIRNGLPLEYDSPIAERPVEPDMRDGVNIWFFEENGEFGVPRLAVDAVGDSWDNRRICANFAFPSGRVLGGWFDSPGLPSKDENGNSTILGTEALKFRLIEPFRKWHVQFDSEVIDSDTVTQVAGKTGPNKKAHIRIDAEITLQIPVWSQVFAEDDNSLEAGWMGRGWRYETPVKIEGLFEIDGKSRNFKGIGNLIRRKSKRAKIQEFQGHTWLAGGCFPDGRAFACNVYPKQENRPQFNMGYLYKDGKFYEAKAVEVPWLDDLIFRGEDLSVTLESELGLTHIKGESLLSTFKPGSKNPGMGGLNMQQGGVLFTWDGQTTIGMTERSSYVQATD